MINIKNRKKDTSLKAIDLFSGCGGLSQGLKDAGFSVVSAVEIDRKAQETYKINHPMVRLYESDIRGLDPAEVLRDVGLMPGELDLLAGCPPCQGFSSLRTKNKRASVKDERNNLVGDFFRFVEVMKPKTVMMENVPGLAKDARFIKMRRALELIGYETTVAVLNAADYAVPQRRKRLILLASNVHKHLLPNQCHNV